MSGIKDSLGRIPGAIGTRNTFRFLVVLLFAAGGGYLLGAASPSILDRLFQWMISLNTRPSERVKSSDTETPAPAAKHSASEVPTIKQKPVDPHKGTKQELKATVRSVDSSPVKTPDHYEGGDFFNVAPFVLVGAILGGFVGVRILNWFERMGDRWDKMDSGDKVTVFVGVFAGLTGSVPFLVLFQSVNIDGMYRGVLVAGVVLLIASLAVYMLQSMGDVLPWNRGRPRNKRSGIRLMDTNVIIDGRIYDVSKTGFLDGQLYIPGFVLEELQYIADSHDPLRRQRGRRGLEVLKHMQAEFPMEVRIHDKLAPDLGDGVDARLVRLAKALGADILTNDFNLKRVAELQDVRVLSLNDLSMSLRPNVLPQETLDLKIIKEGNQYGQGVGYLEDGTMVVVENGQAHIGETMEVIVTQVIQTEKGKMIFAEVDGDGSSGIRRRPTPRRQTYQ